MRGAGRLSVFNRDEDDYARGARAIIALPDLGRESMRDPEARLDEAAGLAEAIGVDVQDKLHFKVRKARPATLFGPGQVERIADAARLAEAELIVVDSAITCAPAALAALTAESVSTVSPLWLTATTRSVGRKTGSR